MRQTHKGITAFLLGITMLNINAQKLTAQNIFLENDSLGIEVPADKIFTVAGYSDNKTGSVEANLRTSQRRTEAVYNTLINEFGVDKAKLKMEYKGGVDAMFFNDYKLNRVVLIE